jgi:hypothetical protein
MVRRKSVQRLRVNLRSDNTTTICQHGRQPLAVIWGEFDEPRRGAATTSQADKQPVSPELDATSRRELP